MLFFFSVRLHAVFSKKLITIFKEISHTDYNYVIFLQCQTTCMLWPYLSQLLHMLEQKKVMMSLYFSTYKTAETKKKFAILAHLQEEIG